MTDKSFGFITPENLSLFTDLYELTMMQGYFKRDHNPTATFDLFVRDLPPDRGYMISAGLRQATSYLETIEFGDDVLNYLADQDFHSEFLDYLKEFSFSGSLKAIPEGNPVFPNEPLIEITAPLIEAQLFETLLINQVGFQSLIATKAARMRDVIERMGNEQTLVDFGSRRAHGTDAGLKAARASYIGGFAGSSNVAAGEQFGLPVFGTMAHSWIESFERERDAFEEFVKLYGEDSILLIDTYDTRNGARIARDVVDECTHDIRGVRIDSGDLAELSVEVNEIVDDIGVFVSSGVDEYALKDFFEQGGVATGFGVGTNLVTSSDAPKLEGVYKLMAVEENGSPRPVMKLSSGKVTFPGRKSVRRIETDNHYQHDILGIENEELPGDELLTPIYESGTRVHEQESLEDIRERTLAQLRKVPLQYRQITDPSQYDVRISDQLQEMKDELEQKLQSQVNG